MILFCLIGVTKRSFLVKKTISLSLLVPLALLTTIAISACSDSPKNKGGNKLHVVATTSIAADIVREIGGDKVNVTQLIPDSVSPHSYSASAKDRAEIADANLIVFFGAHLEENLPLDNEKFAISEHVGQLRDFNQSDQSEKTEHSEEHSHTESAHDHDETEHEEHHHDHTEANSEHKEHSHSGVDPHVWTDPTRIAKSAPELAEVLGKNDPKNKAYYLKRAKQYQDKLAALDREISKTLSVIPKNKRKIVTSHDAFGYFIDHYDLQFVGAPFGNAPEAEASANTLAKLKETIEADKVATVFVQKGDNPKTLEELTDSLGVKVVDDLLVESFAGKVKNYPDMLRFNARLLADNLK